mmetsp:Transcript_26323/g.73732  ORF Transcript_26323/g.73732 Transcript_26323/m.73732 type:complete len:83 (-) Transcript_26323:318-566(-)
MVPSHCRRCRHQAPVEERPPRGQHMNWHSGTRQHPQHFTLIESSLTLLEEDSAQLHSTNIYTVQHIHSAAAALAAFSLAAQS